MAHGWHYTKLSLSSALLLSFSGILQSIYFVKCSFLLVVFVLFFVMFFCSRSGA